ALDPLSREERGFPFIWRIARAENLTLCLPLPRRGGEPMSRDVARGKRPVGVTPAIADGAWHGLPLPRRGGGQGERFTYSHIDAAVDVERAAGDIVAIDDQEAHRA